MKTVPLTSKGIMDFVDSLHQAAANMDAEVQAHPGAFRQQFLGPWKLFMESDPWVDSSPPLGLVSLCDDIRSPLHVIDATTDYNRLARFNVRLRAFWTQAANQDGYTWTEPKPDTTTPGKSSNQIDDFLSGLRGDAITVALLLGAFYIITSKRR